jgi:Ser/Thr protein kinase RdoA (MazF antagonist)
MTVKEIIYQYFPESTKISFKQSNKGAINSTYQVVVEKDGEKKYYILQKMHKMFDVSIIEDIDFITTYLSTKEVKTQRVVKTKNGELFVRDNDSWWRMLTFIPGKILSFISSPAQVKEAGQLVGKFHNALIDCDYKFKFKLSHYHDVGFTMGELESVLKQNKNADKYIELKNIADDILIAYKNVSKKINLPKHIIHNDLKITNIVFDGNKEKALALIDLDTLSYGTVAVELGDALRSWCMTGGEDTEKVVFDINTYKASLEGYFSTAKFLTEEEKKSIPFGVQLITLELAARFVIDAFNENYWNLDSSKYKNLFEQNKKRAHNQFDFFKKFSFDLNTSLV